MYPDLDKKAGYIFNTSLKKKTLDVHSENEIKYADLYEDFDEKKRMILASNVVSFAAVVLKEDLKIIDMTPILATDDKRFVQTCYVKLLGRKAEDSAVNNANELLKGKMTKLDFINTIVASEEFKKRNIILTGYNKLPLSFFLQYEGKEFMDMAYIMIFRRLPDEAGKKNYLRIMKIGEMSPVEVLYDMLHSPEGQENKLVIEGLDEAYAKRMKHKRLYSRRGIGKIARFFNNLRYLNARLNVLSEEVMELDELQEKNAKVFASHINEIQVQLTLLSGNLDRIKRQYKALSSAVAKVDKYDSKIKEIETINEQIIDNIHTLNRAREDLDLYAHEIGDNLNAVNKAREELDTFSHQIADNVNILNSTVSGMEQNVDSLSAQVNGMGANVSSLNTAVEGISINVTTLNKYTEDLRRDGEAGGANAKDVALLNNEVSNLKVQVKRLKENQNVASSGDTNASPVAPSVALPAVNNEDEYESIDYFDFENHFRGSRESIKKVQEIYLPYFKDCKNVLDLGCGRGEFTELLKDNGIGVTGVDMYEPYVEYMKMLDLPAIYDDAISYLKKADSTDGIFVGQVVEHLSIGQIIELCNTAYEKLTEGGYLIMETPNPKSLFIFTSSFYMDPSHQKPVHPYTLQYIASKAGFSSVEILFTDSSKPALSIPKLKENDPDFKEFNDAMVEVANILYGSQDYSIIARK